MRTVYLVMGVGESTGCRFITSILISCGIYGSAEHQQEFDNILYDIDLFKEQTKTKDRLVIRQSWPHGSGLPSLREWYYKLKYCEYDKVYIIFTTRDWATQSVSIVDSAHTINNRINDFFSNPINRIKEAYKNIFSELACIEAGKFSDFFVLNLGDLISESYVNLKFLLESININVPSDFDFDIVKKNIDTDRYKYIKNNYSNFILNMI